MCLTWQFQICWLDNLHCVFVSLLRTEQQDSQIMLRIGCAMRRDVIYSIEHFKNTQLHSILFRVSCTPRVCELEKHAETLLLFTFSARPHGRGAARICGLCPPILDQRYS